MEFMNFKSKIGIPNYFSFYLCGYDFVNALLHTKYCILKKQLPEF
jgi:hypothetical protein